MPAFFASARGAVTRVLGPNQQVVPFSISIDGLAFQSAIMTQVAVQQGDNYQFLHTLDDTIFAYVFGGRMGEIMIGGAAFALACYNNSDTNGIDEIQNMFAENRMSVRPEPAALTVGQSTYMGFLTDMNLNMADPENNISQFGLHFSSFPGQ